MLIKLAWKNIWRNKKRTIIVTISIFFAVVLSSVMRSAQIGSFDYMIYSLAHMHMGYIQIQNPKFMDNRSLDNALKLDGSKVNKIREIPYLTGSSNRLETFALLSNDTLTRIAQIIGIDPVFEQDVTGIQEKVIKGQFLTPGDKGILIGDELAKKLSLGLRDTVVLMSSGYHGISAAALLEVRGILHFPISAMNKTMLYMDIEHAQQLFSMPGLTTSFVITIDNIDNLTETIVQLNEIIDDSNIIRSWQELMPEIEQFINMKNGSSYILIAILYMVIGFGIFGVIMMMTMEREKEYGILNGLGMTKFRMLYVSITENFFIALIGVTIGMLCAVPVLSILADNPIPIYGEAVKSWEQMGIEPVMTFSNNAGIFIYQASIVFIITSICSLYPLFFLIKLNIVNALKK